MRRRVITGLLILVVACGRSKPPDKSLAPGTEPTRATIEPTQVIALDDTIKSPPRLVAVETYLRTLLHIFGYATPLEAQADLRSEELFDMWPDYFSALGLPDYGDDIERRNVLSVVSLAALERIGIGFCNRAVARDTAAPIDERRVFAFDLTAAEESSTFAARFDVLHRTFLGYPASLAGEARTARFHALHRATLARHADLPVGSRAFDSAQAAWAVICHGLVRHPEFHLY